MKAILHKANSRGHASQSWLNTYHTFSFASYHDPLRVHFGELRVLNDDTVAPGMGFGMHPHDNMEIVTIPLEGDLEHRDSTGRHEIIRQGDVQIMSAGKGIYHSEINANKDKEVKLLQIWVFPKNRDIEPRYDQKSYPVAGRQNKLQTVVAPDDDTAVWANQDMWFSLGHFSEGFETTYTLKKATSGVYAFVISGAVTINGQLLNNRDGLGISEVEMLNIKADKETELLLMEIPMLN